MESGIINSSFIIGYIVLSPLFSYLVYKYNKINLIFTGLIIWSISNLVHFSNYNYYFFIIARIFVDFVYHLELFSKLLTFNGVNKSTNLSVIFWLFIRTTH